MYFLLRYILIFLIISFCHISLFGQYEPDTVLPTEEKEQSEKKKKRAEKENRPKKTAPQTSNEAQSTIYKRETIGGALLHSNGWGLNLAFGKRLSKQKKIMWTIEFVHMRHPKEIKSFNPRSDNSRGYKYGKLNNFYIFRGTFGMKKIIFEKIRDKGVEISYNLDAGPSLGLTKPVYLRVRKSPGNNRINANVVEERYDPEKHKQEDIYGGAPWVKGLGDMTPYPGVSARAGLNFEYSPKEKGILAIEVGATFDAFAKKIPIMAFDINNQPLRNDNLFFNFYISVKYGRKHYR